MTSDANAAVLAAILRRDLDSFLHKTFNTLNPGQRYVPG
jgi:hypothetical protein